MVKLFLFGLLLLAGLTSTAQSEIGNFIVAGSTNANLLAKAYMSPISKAYAANLGSGWFAPAQNNSKPWHVNLSVMGTGSWAPNNQKSFNLNNIGLSNQVRLNPGQNPYTPTALGPNEQAGSATKVYTTKPGTTEEVFLADLSAPEGLGVPLVPLPAAQLSVSITRTTQITGRFLPAIKYNFNGTNYETGCWGFGVQQQLNELLTKKPWPVKLMLVLSAGQQLAHTTLTTTKGYYWQNGNITQMTPEQRHENYYHDQQLHVKTLAYTAQLLVSKQWKAMNFYTGGKLVAGNNHIDATGLYPQRDIRATTRSPYYEFYYRDVYDPINTGFNATQLGVNAGVQLQVKGFVWQVEGVLSAYKTLSMGLGFTL